MARKYARDNAGRFSSTGATARGGRLRTSAGAKRANVTAKATGGKPKGAMQGKVKRDPGALAKVGTAKPKPSKGNRITRDNAGKITSVGGEGATARGGRLRTASGKKRATATRKIKGDYGSFWRNRPKNTMPGKVKRDPNAMAKVGTAKPKPSKINRITRNNAGKVTSVGGDGGTARGGRLRTPTGKKRKTVTSKATGGKPKGTMKGKVKRDPDAMFMALTAKAKSKKSKPKQQNYPYMWA